MGERAERLRKWKKSEGNAATCHAFTDEAVRMTQAAEHFKSEACKTQNEPDAITVRRSVAMYPHIDNQHAEGIGSCRLGVTTVSHGGCGVIATYNTLLDLGNNREFKYVLGDYNEGFGTKLYFGGLAGITPGNVVRYFKRAGYKVTTTDDLGEIDKLSQSADGCILYYRWKSNKMIPPYYAHYISYHRNGNGYSVYNDSISTFQQPSAYITESGYTAIGIFIYK